MPMLKQSEAKLFYRSRARLELLANKRLHVADLRAVGPDGLPDEREEQKVLQAVWGDTSVIADVLAGHLDDIPTEQVDVLSSWRSALTGDFAVVMRGSDEYFLGFGRAFKVYGLTQSIRGMLSRVPTMVRATLLPLGRRIVYDGFLEEYPLAMSDNWRKQLQRELQELRDAGKVIEDGRVLARESADLLKEELDERAKRVANEAELDMQGDDVPEGFHRGALAGLDAGAREEAVRRHYDELAAADAPYRRKRARELMLHGEPTQDLAELLSASYTKDQLMGLGRGRGIRYMGKMRKAELAGRLADVLGGGEKFFQGMLSWLYPEEIDRLHDFLCEGGMRLVPDGASDVPKPPVLSYLTFEFAGERGVTYVAPRQLVELEPKIDWDQCRSLSEQRLDVVSYADVCCELRGITTLVEVTKDYLRDHLDADPFATVAMLSGAAQAGESGYDWVALKEGTVYLMSFAASEEYRRDVGITSTEPMLLEAPESDFIDYIETRRDGKEPRPPMEGVEDLEDLEEWVRALPAVVAMRDYLDAHVPDGTDDYGFADDALDELIDYMRIGLVGAQCMKDELEILRDHGVEPTEAMLRRLVGLLADMGNAIPVWTNNGWSPNELMARQGR